GMPAPPTVQKVNPADQPVIFLVVTGPTMQLSKVDEYAENLMAQRISMVNGVSQVNVFGPQKWAIHVQLDPSLLASRRIGIDEVESHMREMMPGFRTLIPPAVNMLIEMDRSEPILESVNDVKFTLLLTMGLVVLVIFLFLRNLSATVIPSLALPSSVIGTFA